MGAEIDVRFVVVECSSGFFFGVSLWSRQGPRALRLAYTLYPKPSTLNSKP
jgi:hypothetical protein